MHKEKELLEKVEKHLKTGEIILLQALITDINGFNKEFSNNGIEMYIDFNNIGNDSEYDPYLTFSIKLHDMSGNHEEDEVVHDYLSLKDLDNCLCAIECYHEEMKNMLDDNYHPYGDY